MGTGLYPQALCLVQCGGWAYPVVWTAVALLDGGLLIFFFFVRLPIVDGTGVFVVWWSVKFVFRIVDGTGMFSVSSW